MDTCNLLGLNNLISEPTCFKAVDGTLLDVILTTNRLRTAEVFNLSTGISDYHNMVGFSTKLFMPKMNKKDIIYRSYKSFNDFDFKKELAYAPFHVADIFDDLDDAENFHLTLIGDIIEHHAPLKRRKPVDKPVPYINSKMRKACHQKSMSRNRYLKKK